MDNPKECNPEKGLFFLGDIVVDGNLLRAKSGEECCLRCQENAGGFLCYGFGWQLAFGTNLGIDFKPNAKCPALRTYHLFSFNPDSLRLVSLKLIQGPFSSVPLIDNWLNGKT